MSNLDGLNGSGQGRGAERQRRGAEERLADAPAFASLAAGGAGMRNKDRDMGNTDMGSREDREWSGNIGSDSSDRDDRMRNQEDE